MYIIISIACVLPNARRTIVHAEDRIYYAIADVITVTLVRTSDKLLLFIIFIVINWFIVMLIDIRLFIEKIKQ